MKRKIKDIYKKIEGLEYALENEFNRKVPFNLLGLIRHRTIDIKLLTKVQEGYVKSESDQYSSYERTYSLKENLYIVWKDNKVEKSDKIDYQITYTTVDDWTGEITSRDQSEHWEIEPIASHFVKNDDIKHLILIESNSSKYLDEREEKFNSVKVKIFHPSSKINVTETSKSIMRIWESEGQSGLEDYIFNMD